jgi:hypothetical protein
MQAKKNAAIDSQMRERERVLKAKDYAKKQREINREKAEAKKAGPVVPEQV